MNVNLIGKTFGRLKVIDNGKIVKSNDGRSRRYWVCICECGNIAEVETSKLTSGHTKSCGCIAKERISKVNYKNGLSQSRIYRTHRNMINRCYNKNVDMYYCYGAKGITVCDEWKNKETGFQNFYDWAIHNGYTDELTIDRIDVAKGYCPENCRWITMDEQANNKNNTKRLKINGEIDTVANWSRRLKVSYWNLLNYAKGGKNEKYPELKVERVE